MTQHVRRPALLALALTAALALAGCGDDPEKEPATKDAPSSSATTKDPAVAALATAFADEDALGLTAEESECIGTTLVDDAGPDRLVEWKVLDDSHQEATLRDEPEAFVAARTRALSACVGLLEVGLRAQRSLLETMATTPEEKAKAADDAYWTALGACLAEEIPEDEVLAAFLADETDPAIEKRATEATERCEAAASD